MLLAPTKAYTWHASLPSTFDVSHAAMQDVCRLGIHKPALPRGCLSFTWNVAGEGDSEVESRIKWKLDDGNSLLTGSSSTIGQAYTCPSAAG